MSGSATSESIGWVNVTDSDWGAVGDGVTDDTVAIQNAINYAATVNPGNGTNPVVWFPPGLYIVSGPISIPVSASPSSTASGISLWGAGPSSSLIGVTAYGSDYQLTGTFNAGETIYVTFVKGSWTYQSPTYTIKSCDSLRTIAQAIAESIQADTAGPVIGVGTGSGEYAPYIYAAAFADVSPIASMGARIYYLLFSGITGTAATLSYTYSGTGSLSLAGGGAFAAGAIPNYNVFSTLLDTGGSESTQVSAEGFGAFRMGFVTPGSQCYAGALFNIPTAKHMHFDTLRTDGIYNAFILGQSPPQGGDQDTAINYVHIRFCDFDGMTGTWLIANAGLGNILIEDIYLKGPNSGDGHFAAVFFADPIVNSPLASGNGAAIGEFQMKSVDIEGYGIGVFGSWTTGGIDDSTFADCTFDGNSTVSIFLQGKPGAVSTVIEDTKIRDSFITSGTHGIWIDGGYPTDSVSFGSIIGCHQVAGMSGGAHEGVGGTPFGLIQVYNPTAQIGVTQAAPYPAPTLSTGAVSANTLPAGTYFVKYTFTTSQGETVASGEHSIVFAGGSTTGLLVTVSNATYPNATGINVYMSATASSETLQGSASFAGSNSVTYTRDTPLVLGSSPSTINNTGATCPPGVTVGFSVTDVTTSKTFTGSYTTLGDESPDLVAQYLANIMESSVAGGTPFATYFQQPYTVGTSIFFFLNRGLTDTVEYSASVDNPASAGLEGLSVYLPMISSAVMGIGSFVTGTATAMYGNGIEFTGNAGEWDVIGNHVVQTPLGFGIHLNSCTGISVKANRIGQGSIGGPAPLVGIQIEIAALAFDVEANNVGDCGTAIVDNSAGDLTSEFSYISSNFPYNGLSLPQGQPPFPPTLPNASSGSLATTQAASQNLSPYNWLTHSISAHGNTITQVQIANGDAVAATVKCSLGGTLHSGDTLTTTINGHAIAVTVASETGLGQLATAIRNAINASTLVNALVFAGAETGSAPGVVITAILPGKSGNAITIACSVSTGATETYVAGSATLLGGLGQSMSYAPTSFQVTFAIPAGAFYTFTYGGGTVAPQWFVQGL